MFKKGQSGNAKGRPKIEDSAAAAIRKAISSKDWEAMAKSLYMVVLDQEQKGKDRAAAYNSLADRAFGKAVQKQVITQLPTPPIDGDMIKNMQESLGLPILESVIINNDDSDEESNEL